MRPRETPPAPPVDPRPLLVIVGPTAAGKSGLAMALCDEVGGEIVSADSVAVYRGLDIGSAKPTLAEQARTAHHCIDLVDPAEQLDAAAWAGAADRAIASIRSRGAVPIVVGGTGLYVRALLHGLVAVPDIDPDVRDAVREGIAVHGSRAAHAELALVDPLAAERIAPNDRQRVGRALEVFRSTGTALSDWQEAHRFAPRRYPAARVVGLWPEREELYARIDQRVATMLHRGLVEEVRRHLDAGVSPDASGLRSLGYREVVATLTGAPTGASSPAELRALIARSHRRYARRQLVWFRGVSAREDDLEHLGSGAAAAQERLRGWLLAS